MRTSLLLLALATLLPATADAQRRYRYAEDAERGTDLQVLAQGLHVDGVGLRFWLSPRTALATRLDFGFTSNDEADATNFGLGVGLNVERHMDADARVHSYFTAGGHVGVASFSREGFGGEDTFTQTMFGGEAGLGAEARLMGGLSLSAQYTLGVNFVTGDAPGGPRPVFEDGPMNGQHDSETFNVRLGGVPRLALSFRF